MLSLHLIRKPVYASYREQIDFLKQYSRKCDFNTFFCLGGTWMGLNTKSGSLAALTNVRTKLKIPETALSRGKMVFSFLEGGVERVTANAENDYYAYHMMKCNNIFANPPDILCQHCLPLSTQQAETWTRTSHTIPFPSSWACSNEGGDSCFAGIAEIAGAAGYMHTGQGAEGCLWPKTAWLRGQAAQVVASLGLDVKGEDGARLLADLIGEHLCSRKLFTEKEMPDLRFSPLPRQAEEFLQNGPYIDAKKQGGPAEYGTVSQTLIIRSSSARVAFYLYRCTHGRSADEAKSVAWQVFCVPDPSL